MGIGNCAVLSWLSWKNSFKKTIVSRKPAIGTFSLISLCQLLVEILKYEALRLHVFLVTQVLWILAGTPEDRRISKKSKVGNSNCRRASLSISTATKVPKMFFVEGWVDVELSETFENFQATRNWWRDVFFVLQTTCWFFFLCFSDFKVLKNRLKKLGLTTWELLFFFGALYGCVAWQGFYHYLRFEVMLKS